MIHLPITVSGGKINVQVCLDSLIHKNINSHKFIGTFHKHACIIYVILSRKPNLLSEKMVTDFCNIRHLTLPRFKSSNTTIDIKSSAALNEGIMLYTCKSYCIAGVNI